MVRNRVPVNYENKEFDSVIIRKPESSDEASWRELFDGYQRFYRAVIEEEAIAETWRRIHDPDAEVDAFVAEQDGELIGMTHYLFHKSTWAKEDYCYLEDLFVSKAARGSDAAEKLIAAVEADATAQGAVRLYWHTQQFNSAARSLYDTVAIPTSFMVYEKEL